MRGDIDSYKILTGLSFVGILFLYIFVGNIKTMEKNIISMNIWVDAAFYFINTISVIIADCILIDPDDPAYWGEYYQINFTLSLIMLILKSMVKIKIFLFLGLLFYPIVISADFICKIQISLSNSEIPDCGNTTLSKYFIDYLTNNFFL